MMKFTEALTHMESGFKVARTKVGANKETRLVDGEFQAYVDTEWIIRELTTSDILADDWVVVGSPLRKVEITKTYLVGKLSQICVDKRSNSDDEFRVQRISESESFTLNVPERTLSGKGFRTMSIEEDTYSDWYVIDDVGMTLREEEE